MLDVLAHCEHFRHWPPSLDYAARLAAYFDSRLTGIYVCPTPNMLLAPYGTPQLMADMLELARQLTQEAFSFGPSFETFARSRGAMRASWQVADGEVLPALELIGHWHDVLVIGRTPNTPWGSVAAVGSMVLGVHMPCLVVPETQAGAIALDSIAIAWNGSVEAIKATHAALPILRRARKVTILHGKQQMTGSMALWKPPFDLADYLASHGILSETQLLPESTESVGGLLVGAARLAKADLLVMGAYGHTRFSEWILGGATRSVLERINLPVFMFH
jgi:nucleotide-binding universal stress UspA family protein